LDPHFFLSLCEPRVLSPLAAGDLVVAESIRSKAEKWRFFFEPRPLFPLLRFFVKPLSLPPPPLCLRMPGSPLSSPFRIRSSWISSSSQGRRFLFPVLEKSPFGRVRPACFFYQIIFRLALIFIPLSPQKDSAFPPGLCAWFRSPPCVALQRHFPPAQDASAFFTVSFPLPLMGKGSLNLFSLCNFFPQKDGREPRSVRKAFF